MTPQGHDLAPLLDRWNTPDRTLDDRASLAGQLVDSARRALVSPTAQTSPVWHRWLDVTRMPGFLRALPDRAARHLWAETAIDAVRVSSFTLETMLDQRVAAHPNHPFLRAPAAGPSGAWSYLQVQRRARAIAACLLRLEPSPPRVAIIADNGLTAACTDLACLAYDILVAPLGVHLAPREIDEVLSTLAIDTVVTDSEARYRSLVRLRSSSRAFRILRTDLPAAPLAQGDLSLPSSLSDLDSHEISSTIASRRRLGLDQASTVMFTPSSTGDLKGVQFSQLNLVSKRFARAAALPNVGDDETLVCYLPLFNTFGRFLELLGCLFWGGTYVFAGNPSLDTLLSQLAGVRPTGLVSVPVRWAQLHARCLTTAGREADPASVRAAFVRTTGGRLRWGLSAAGRLEPATFRFFQEMGVALCSGFGMTEATGGITMTPPGEYKDESLGIPLPAIDVRLDDRGEMHIRGPYVGRQLRPGPANDGWFATGDVFRVDADGHYTIVDKLKDIYKNSRGQTVAPLRVEQKLLEVPGVAAVFVAGDGRDDNVALICLDASHPDIASLPDAGTRSRYVADAICRANLALAPFERVVDFRLVQGELAARLRELTADCAPRRKLVVQLFSDDIGEMYAQRSLSFPCGALTAIVPRWLPRDLGVLLSDFECDEHGLIDRRSHRTLEIAPSPDGRTRIGDLDYEVDGDSFDLGRLVRQPALWVGNRALASFASCKDGWDARAEGISGPFPPSQEPHAQPPSSAASPTRALASLHEAVASALLDPAPACLASLDQLAAFLAEEPHQRNLARSRLSLLARSPHAPVRGRAFTALCLDPGTADDASELLAFLRAGLPHLDAHALAQCIASPLMPSRLDAFRLAASGLTDQARAALVDWLDAWVESADRSKESLHDVRGFVARWAELSPDPVVRQRAQDLLAKLGAGDLDRTRRLQMASIAAPHVHSPFPDGAASLAEPSFTSLDDATREIVGAGPHGPTPSQLHAFRTLWTRGMVAFLRASQSLDTRFVALPVSPSCVSVGPGCTDRLELVGIRSFDTLPDPARLLELVAVGFYPPNSAPWRSPSWLLDALAEVFGVEGALGHGGSLRGWTDTVQAWAESVRTIGYIPVAVRCALADYRTWLTSNPDAEPQARLRWAEELGAAHRLGALPLTARLHYARETRFAQADSKTRNALDRLIATLASGTRTPLHELVEIADLFEATASRDDRIALRQMVFGG